MTREEIVARMELELEDSGVEAGPLVRAFIESVADGLVEMWRAVGSCAPGRHVIQEGRVGCKCEGVAVLPAETPGDEIVVMVYNECP